MKNGLLRPEHARVLNLLRDFAPVGLERFGHGCRFRITRPALRHLARMGWATFEENALTKNWRARITREGRARLAQVAKGAEANGST